MKIAFIGSQCTGKTSLIEELLKNDKFENYNKSVNVVSTLAKEMGDWKFSDDTTPIFQKILMDKFISDAFCNKSFTLYDRTTIDCYVYSKWLYDFTNHMSDDEFGYITDRFYKSLWLYDHVFYLKPEFAYVNNGVRSNNMAYRDQITQLFDETITELKENFGKSVDHIGIHISGTMEERVDSVLKYLEGGK